VIVESKRETTVVQSVDVVVAGGGPSGLAAAVAAARNGAEVLLVERYGYLGGLGAGGLVIRLYETVRYGYGLSKELVERLSALGGAELSTPASGTPQWVEGAQPSGAECWDIDPEILKYVADEMVSESGVDLLLHSLVVGPVMEGSTVRGVILEGKSGRQVVLGKVVVDATGDGDVAAAAGASYGEDRHSWGVNLDCRIGNVDVDEATRFRDGNPELYKELMERFEREVGKIRWVKTLHNGVVWGGPPRYRWIVDALDTRDLTRVEVESRKIIIDGLGFLRENMPGFQDAFLLETANQLGIRETRRITGEYTLTKEDILGNKRFDDAVADVQTLSFDIPYRCLVPKKVEGLLVAGRCISATHEALGAVRNIPPCLITGQAAGTAAALAAKKNVSPRELSTSVLRETLRSQGVKIRA
jgi:hypothetical protein